MFNVYRIVALIAFALIVYTAIAIYTYDKETRSFLFIGESAGVPASIPDTAREMMPLVKISEEDVVISTYTYGGYKRNVMAIPEWQYKIMDDLKIPDKTKLYLRTVNTQECQHPDGICRSPGKKQKYADCGFFQINNIHSKDFKWCLATIDKMLEAKEKKDWDTFVYLRNALYESQVFWTWQRMKGQVKRLNLTEDRVKRMEKLCILHNGHPIHKYNYGNRCEIAYKKLRDFYIFQ